MIRKKPNPKLIACSNFTANLIELFFQKYRNKNFIVHIFHLLQSDIEPKKRELNIPNQQIIQPCVSITLLLYCYLILIKESDYRKHIFIDLGKHWNKVAKSQGN